MIRGNGVVKGVKGEIGKAVEVTLYILTKARDKFHSLRRSRLDDIRTLEHRISL